MGEFDVSLLKKEIWKKFTDITDSISCKIKFKDAVKYSKGVPVMGATNSSLWEELFSKAQTDNTYSAICRRIAGIRYYENFRECHPEFYIGSNLKPEFLH
jgi:hypothetical protein